MAAGVYGVGFGLGAAAFAAGFLALLPPVFFFAAGLATVFLAARFFMVANGTAAVRARSTPGPIPAGRSLTLVGPAT
jgi:hypothetical protein